jgi:hypothetical protein
MPYQIKGVEKFQSHIITIHKKGTVGGIGFKFNKSLNPLRTAFFVNTD